MPSTDYLIIGSGIAGLTLAAKLAARFPKRQVTIVTKAGTSQCNTRYAQGGIASVVNTHSDSFQQHIQDTLRAGDGLCDPLVVEKVVSEGPQRIQELLDWGVQFDRAEDGCPNLALEGGHTRPRVLHHKDQTGKEIQRILIRQVLLHGNIKVLPHHFAVDLLLSSPDAAAQPSRYCKGAVLLDQISGSKFTMWAQTVTLATGGIGEIYGNSTNPAIATGDGIAIAARAGAHITDMEFVQFHPTALYTAPGAPAFLITEALRGAGAVLKNTLGERFMDRYHELADLAPRDIVSRFIINEMKHTQSEHVLLDATSLSKAKLIGEFPNIYKTCLQHGWDLARQWIPVVPAAHYLCGGIAVDRHGATSIPNLFACGECARTGLHGANRLASNSLLEALVYAHAIFECHRKKSPAMPTIAAPKVRFREKPIFRDLLEISRAKQMVQQLMQRYVGVVRDSEGLRMAQISLQKIAERVESLFQDFELSTDLCELRNSVAVAQLCVAHSLNRKENRGGYFNKDYITNAQTQLV